MSAPNPWHPMADPVDVKHLGKLLEELGELTAACSRCLIQGIDESEPVSGKPNRQWLQEELADVLAGIDLCIARFKLNDDAIAERIGVKTLYLQKWHRLS